MKKIRERIKIMRAVRQLLDQRNEAVGVVMIKTKSGFVEISGGKPVEIGATMTVASVKDITGVTKMVLLGVADWIRDHQNDNAEGTTEPQNDNNDAANDATAQKEENAQE
ncbi:MAG: hypothetical protein IKN32_00020 [Bacteroidales bacterium]|nr:hypothetical protein [Bacteroidales bacterium]